MITLIISMVGLFLGQLFYERMVKSLFRINDLHLKPVKTMATGFDFVSLKWPLMKNPITHEKYSHLMFDSLIPKI